MASRSEVRLQVPAGSGCPGERGLYGRRPRGGWSVVEPRGGLGRHGSSQIRRAASADRRCADGPAGQTSQ
eukprot:2543218-Prorocentrum_lima.AAC.1